MKFRSSCLIASTLDLIGDKWSLLLIRDMLMHKKKSFKELVGSEEGIATNLLSSRLKLLESLDVITKRKLPSNKKENIYLLTEKGMDLAPILLEIVIWSDKYVREYHKEMNAFENDNLDRTQFIENVRGEYRKFAQNVLN
ncbi:MAG: helix-turn-helix transcriptional regulator [Trichodesmium erythraeum GBRTRLIN201]|nr:helix-turn-helix transcriptional regulator [Trichodesmium erythraeum GBRTRLIN201]